MTYPSAAPAASDGSAAPESGREDGAAKAPRVTRRAALALGGALAGAAAARGVDSALAGHVPPEPTPNRPPPASDLVSYEETKLAFRNHGFHTEMLDRPITPLGSHYLLIHFDVPEL